MQDAGRGAQPGSGEPLDEALRRRDAILGAVAAAAELLLEGSFDERIGDVMRLLGEATGASRAYLFEHRRDGEEVYSQLRHEWLSPGTAPSSPIWQEFCYGRDGFLDSLEAFRRGEITQRKASALPPRERAIMEDDGSKSLLEGPIFVEGELWGDFGFDDCVSERDWLPAEIDAIRAAAGILGAALGRKRAEERLRESEELLRQSQKMEAVGQLAGGIAHDFNNLLTVITGFSGLLLDRVGPLDPSRRDIEQIAEAAERAVAVTSQLLAFSRRQTRAPRPVDLNAVVKDTETMLLRLIGEDIEFSTSLDPDLGHVLADPGQLEQIVVNLAINARDAMPEGGVLEISTATVDVEGGGHLIQRPGRYAALSVRDTGHGMDAETRSRIFEPFFTTKEKGKGTGLGLATVYGIARQTGGDVTAYSAVGEGTTFTVYLPLDVPVPAAAPPSPHAESGATGRTILLAEDEDIVRDLLATILEGRGYTILAAGDGEEAADVAADHSGPIDLLVTDVIMPRRSGRELAEHLRRERPGIKVLYISGYTDDASVRGGALEAGAPLLQKPFSADELANAVSSLLGADGPAGA